MNECRFNPCQNGGNCVNIEGSYQCQCPNEWTGHDCEIGKVVSFFLWCNFTYVFLHLSASLNASDVKIRVCFVYCEALILNQLEAPVSNS